MAHQAITEQQFFFMDQILLANNEISNKISEFRKCDSREPHEFEQLEHHISVWEFKLNHLKNMSKD